MLKFRQTVWSLRSSNMLLSRAGLAPQTGLESFPRFQVIRQGFPGRHCHSLNCSLRASDLIHEESLWNSVDFRLDIKRWVATRAGLSEDGGSHVPLCLPKGTVATANEKLQLAFFARQQENLYFFLKQNAFQGRGINKVRNKVSSWEWCREAATGVGLEEIHSLSCSCEKLPSTASFCFYKTLTSVP